MQSATNETTSPAPRTGDNRAWFEWALNQFWFFEEAPRPAHYKDVEKWVIPFDKWADENLSDTCKAIAGFVLRFWNSSRRWRSARAMEGDFHRALANMDSGNKAGIVRLIQNARWF